MRHTYSLQTETIKVLKGNEAHIADAMDVSDRYIYAILGGNETDPFAKFLTLYSAAVRSGAPTRYWDERLKACRLRNERHGKLDASTEAARLASEAADVSAAFIEARDSHTKLREVREEIAQAKRLERALIDEMRLSDAPKTNGHIIDVRKIGRDAVAAKRGMG